MGRLQIILEFSDPKCKPSMENEIKECALCGAAHRNEGDYCSEECEDRDREIDRAEAYMDAVKHGDFE